MPVPDTPSFTPQPLVDAETLRERVRYCTGRGWAMVVEYTDDPSPDNHFWKRWGLPLLNPGEPDLVLYEIEACRKRFPASYIRLLAYGPESARTAIRDTVLVHAPGG